MSENAKRRGAEQPRPGSDKAASTRTQKKTGVPSARGNAKPGRASAEPARRKAPMSAEAKDKALKATGAPEKRRAAQSAGAKARGGKGDAPVKPGTRSNAAGEKPSGAAQRQSARAKQAAASGKGPAKGDAARKREKAAPRRTSAGIKANPAGEADTRKKNRSRRRDTADDLFMERDAAPQPAAADGTPPRRHTALFGALNACLAIAIAVVVALGLRVHSRYGEFQMMRDVVDKQTFYEGTTVEGVDVSKMTLSNALDYWRERVEARNAGRTLVLDDGTSVTAGELGYSSDYESVLTTAWSHGRSGTLEERYRMAASRRQNPAAYAIHRKEYSEALVDRFVQMQALKIDQEPTDASVADFNVDTYEFTFNPSRTGRQLDAAALKRDLLAALEGGGGNVPLSVAELPPQISTEQIGQMYGLIDYAITNASSSSRSRLNNITLAMSLINGAKLAPGETFSFNERVGQRTSSRGFKIATAYSGGEVTEQVGGGICQVSTTLFNAAVKADMRIDERHNHSLTVHYVDKGKDATVDWGNQDLKFTNTSADDIYICCYLTEDKRVRFGIFGRLLPNGEKITLDAVTTKVNKFETEYKADPSLRHGQTLVSQNGRDGYKAEAYKVRWDADGNELSRELLCSSIYKTKNEIILYGA